MPDRSTSPNILLINCDDMAYADIGCYGSQLNKTPHLDRLAREGVKLTSFYAPAPVCTPSRAGMLTGCYPRRIDMHGFEIINHQTGEVIAEPGQGGVLFPGQAEGLNPKEATLASVLKDQGYCCKLIGKWHLGDQPAFHPKHCGFDSWFGLPYSNDMGLQTRPPERNMAKLPPCPLPLMRDGEVVQQQPDQAAITERYTEDAVRFIRDHAEQPFFLYFAHTYVHGPLFAPQTFLERSKNGVYGACVEEVDWSLGVLCYELERLGLAERTLVIFTNDNGGCPSGNNAPLRGFKGTTWEGGQRVNCILKWPGHIPAGSVSDELTTMMDFFPTFRQIVGHTADDGLRRDGHSLLPVLNGGKSAYETFLYYSRGHLQAIRDRRYKLHLQRRELYDLQADIGESHDRYRQFPDIVERLETLAERARQDLGDDATGTPGANCRPCDRVQHPKPPTVYDERHPYIVALYDTAD